MFVTHDLPPIPVYNRFSILEDRPEQSPVKTWYDFLPQLPIIDEAALEPYSKSASTKASTQKSTPMEVLISARKDLATEAPTVSHQAGGALHAAGMVRTRTDAASVSKPRNRPKRQDTGSRRCLICPRVFCLQHRKRDEENTCLAGPHCQ